MKSNTRIVFYEEQQVRESTVFELHFQKKKNIIFLNEVRIL